MKKKIINGHDNLITFITNNNFTSLSYDRKGDTFIVMYKKSTTVDK